VSVITSVAPLSSRMCATSAGAERGLAHTAIPPALGTARYASTVCTPLSSNSSNPVTPGHAQVGQVPGQPSGIGRQLA